MTRLFSLAALALASAVLLAACGGYGSSSSSSSTSAPTGSRTASLIATKTTSLGTFLVDAKGRTLYLWDADRGSKSVCSGECAQDWPPLTTTGKPKAGDGVKASLLGTTTRANGSREVTYAGHPLYHFEGDAKPGQATGQGSNSFGAPWWAVAPGGTALQR